MRFPTVQSFMLVVVAAWSGVAQAQPACPLPKISLTLKQKIDAPAGFNQVAFFDTTARSQVGTPPVLSGSPPSFNVDALIVSLAKGFKDPATHTPDQIQLRWGKSGDAAAQCLQPFDVQDAGPPPVAPAPAPVSIQQCLTAGQRLRVEIRTERKLGSKAGDDFSLVVFCRDLTSLQIDRDYGVEGDPIYVALFDDGTLDEARAEFPVCSIEQAGPRIFQSETAFPGGVQAGAFVIQRLAQRTCFDASVQIDLKARKPDVKTNAFIDVSKSHILQQARRYHATLQMGALFTDQHPHSFGLRVDEESKKRIFDKGPEGQGPEYTAALVIYALPRQIESLFRRGPTYHGRDILHEKRFADRLGGVLGVGVKDPAKSFAAGFSFEVLDYINVVALYRWARLPGLTGVEKDDVFLGEADQIPVRDKWEGDLEFGVAIDLRYATALFKR